MRSTDDRPLEWQSSRNLMSAMRRGLWAVAVGVAWFLWLTAAGVLGSSLFGLVISAGTHPDADLIFFAALFAGSAIYLMLVGYAGHRLIELARPPLALWKPGVLVVVSSSLASISVRQSAAARIVPSTVMGAIVLPFVLAPAAVLVGMGIAAVQQQARDTRKTA